MNPTLISPDQAKAILDALPKKSLAALRRELVRRGQPVSMPTLRKWQANGWTRKGGTPQPALRAARKAAAKAGLPTDAIQELETRLTAMSDGELIVDVTRRLLINAALLMEQAKHMAPRLMTKDPRGLAALYMAADHMTEGAHDLMREARNTAERALKEKSLLLLPPAGDGNRVDDRVGNRPDTGRQPFADMISRFGAAVTPTHDDPVEAVEVEIIPPTRSVN